MPYAEMGRVCVCCVVLCVAVCVLAGRGIHPYACGGRKVLKGPRKVDSLHTTRFLAFWTICRRNASGRNTCHFAVAGRVVGPRTRRWRCSRDQDAGTVVLRLFSSCRGHPQHRPKCSSQWWSHRGRSRKHMLAMTVIHLSRRATSSPAETVAGGLNRTSMLVMATSK